jgi:hypothetical protein
VDIGGGKRATITIHDVAAAAGVSISTASKALNDTGRMGDETRERVKRVAMRDRLSARMLLHAACSANAASPSAF